MKWWSIWSYPKSRSAWISHLIMLNKKKKKKCSERDITILWFGYIQTYPYLQLARRESYLQETRAQLRPNKLAYEFGFLTSLYQTILMISLNISDDMEEFSKFSLLSVFSSALSSSLLQTWTDCLQRPVNPKRNHCQLIKKTKEWDTNNHIHLCSHFHWILRNNS